LSIASPRSAVLHSFAISAVLVALAEMGDRSQVLAIVLASRYRRALPILAGILVATIVNNGVAALVGYYLGGLLAANWFKYLVSASFIAMAAWALLPDRDSAKTEHESRFGIFITTVLAFSLVELGDKTQIATIALAARFHDVVAVAAGTTLGMLLADVPAVFLGETLTRYLPVKYLRYFAALLYLTLGFWGIASVAGWIR
jgi:putative Ca2+/H+ antiporter (TMEM165/GDT1 family)